MFSVEWALIGFLVQTLFSGFTEVSGALALEIMFSLV